MSEAPPTQGLGPHPLDAVDEDAARHQADADKRLDTKLDQDQS